MDLCFDQVSFLILNFKCSCVQPQSGTDNGTSAALCYRVGYCVPPTAILRPGAQFRQFPVQLPSRVADQLLRPI